MNRARQIRNRERNRHGRIYKRIGGWSICAFNNGEGVSQSITTTNRLIPGDAFFIVIIRASLCGCFNEAAIAVIILIAVLIIKGIKYLRRKEERDTQRDYRSAQNTIDEIERELNDRK